MSHIQLITRGDDAGSSQSANRAIRQCCDEGILRNVSIMVPGPAFEDAVRVLDDLENVDFGLHICLNSEWDAPRWGPVVPGEQVATLLDDNGCFTRMPAELHRRGFDVEEALLEIEAQLAQIRVAGLNVSYIDEHMAVSWAHPELRRGIAALAQREGLIDVHGLSDLIGLHNISATEADSAQHLIEFLSRHPSGKYLLIAHPMFDDDESRSFRVFEQNDGEIARTRDNDRRMLIDKDLVAWFREKKVEPKRFTDVLE